MCSSPWGLSKDLMEEMIGVLSRKCFRMVKKQARSKGTRLA